MLKRSITFQLLGLLLIAAPTSAQTLVFGNTKLQLTLDYNAKATISALTVNGEKVIDGPEGIYSLLKTKTATYSTIHLLATPLATKTANTVTLKNIVYGDQNLKISETWHFIINKDNIKFTIDRTLSKPVEIVQASLPVFNFKSVDTWEGAYQDYGGLAWFYLFNKRAETYATHTHSSKFWNSKTNNGLNLSVDAPGEQVAMSYSRTMTDQLACSITVQKSEPALRLDSGTNRRRFLRDSTDVWAAYKAAGKTTQSITLSYFDFNKTNGRGQLTGVNANQVSAVLNTIARIGVIDKQHFGGNSWHTPYGPICLHEQYIAQLGLAINDSDYLKGYRQCLDFYRDYAIKPDGRVWPRWAYTNEDAMPQKFTDKGFYEAQWGYLLDANPDFVTNVAELYDQTGDLPWVKTHQASCEKALDWICKRDFNGNGLVEMMTDSHEQKKGSDWIDIIWASYENAFVNANLYHALVLWAAIEGRLNNPIKAKYYEQFAEKLKTSFNKPISDGGFWDEANSCYVHWREKDGSIHGDNMVTPVNFMAIGYGICDDTIRRNAILDKIEAQMQKEKLFFWPLCLSTYQKGDGNDWQFPFPNYENGDIFLSWGALGVKCYADYKPAIALRYVKNVLAQYAKDGLAFQRYGRAKQDGLGDDILAGNSLSVVGLYQAIYGINPLYNRLYLNPHLTKELAGTQVNYNFRGQKLTIDLEDLNHYKISNGCFSITSSNDFGFYAENNTLSYFDHAADKPALRINTTPNASLTLDIKSWTPDQLHWNQLSKAAQLTYQLHDLHPNSNYTLSANGKRIRLLRTNAKGDLEFDYTAKNVIEFKVESSAITQLKAGFLSPPDSTRPGVYWYFMDGNRSAQSMTEDLEAMKKAGIGAVIFLEVNVGIPRGKVDFFSDEWQKLFVHAVREAERLGIQITLGIGPGWTGSGGPWVTPEQSMQHLVCSSTQVTGGDNAKPITLPVPPPKKPYFGEDGLTPELKQQWEGFYKDVAVLAFPTPSKAKKIADIDEKALYYRAPFSSVPGVKPYLPAAANYESGSSDELIDDNQIIDLTGKLHADGTLDWKAPPGNWTILRFVARNNGAVTRPAPYPGLGFESDKMDTAALDAHLDHYVGALIRKIGIPDTNVYGGLKRLHMDSWEMGAQNWTPNFRQEFIKRRGYDPLPYYPVYNGDIVGSMKRSERFLRDLRLTAQDLMLEYHAQHLKAFAHNNNLRLSIEPYDMNPTADLELGSVADIPMAEFWSKGFGFNSSFSCIEATSIGHVNGISLIQAEAFTAQDNEGWRQFPGSMKEQGDWAFAAGINRFFYHTFQSQSLPDSLKPGMTMGPYGVHWDRNQTWWPLVKSYHTYISRCQYILQQGRPVADILYLTPEGAPQVFQPPYSALVGEEPIRDRRGYNFDGCSPSQLRTATVINKEIVFPGGAHYKLLVLPNTPVMSPELTNKIASLKADGATIVDHEPGDSLYPSYESTAAILRQMHVGEDFHSNGALRYTHRTAEDYDIYFVANKTGNDLQTTATFRSTKGRPELWDPITGETRTLPEFTPHDRETSIPLQFAAYQSFVIVFNNETTSTTTKAATPPAPSKNFPTTSTIATLAPSWTVSFDPKWGGPDQIAFTSLDDWTHRPEPGIKYYSGIAAYRQTFKVAPLQKGTHYYLDLGKVYDLARITLNGQDLGTVWTAPYKVDITKAIRQGDNQLRIEVANRWPNRLIGDQQLPDDGIANDQWPEWLLQGKPRPGTRFTFTTYNPYQKNSPLLPSGLIGPVTLQQSGAATHPTAIAASRHPIAIAPQATAATTQTPSWYGHAKHLFPHPGDSAQTSVYWYWLSGNISKEGVIKDLESMKIAGINRAFIGNIALSDVAPGKVEFLSPEWWDILHTALKTATRLNIDIGIFNSPGWSQSGGPWIKPEESMRYLASTQAQAEGGRRLTIQLPKPAKDFQDVKVIAFPQSKVDSLTATSIDIPLDSTVIVNLEPTKDFTARSIIVYPSQKAIIANVSLQIKTADSFQTIRDFVVDRSNSALNVGFKPYGPVTISIPATTAKYFRLVIRNPAGNYAHSWGGGPQHTAIQKLQLLSSPKVESYIEKTLAKMCQTPFPLWGQYLWPNNTAPQQPGDIDPATVLDLTNYLQPGGTLIWDAPPGQWTILRSGMVTTGVTNSPAPENGTGLEVDKINHTHLATHFNGFLGQILQRIPEADRKCWKLVVEDSYETGGQNWTDSLPEKFKAVYGYDPTPYIPTLEGITVGSQNLSDRFLWDLRRFIADKVSFEYVGGLKAISHQHGLTTWLENYGHWGFPGEFLQYGGQSDEIGGEFWSEGDLGNIENRAASSSAHIYGKTKVSAESFTCGGAAFSRYPATMKQRGDRFFTEGINNTLLHVYIEQPYADKHPGINAGFGNEFNRNNTWFGDIPLFTDYLKRCNYLLQQGRWVADVAYFIGEDAPKMTGVCDPALPKGYSFDYINADVLKERITVKDGMLVLPNGITYRLLILPKLETMRPELLARIKDLVSQGATIYGPAPKRSPSLQDFPNSDTRVQQLAAQLWDKINGSTITVNNYGAGRVIDGIDLQAALTLIGAAPDCSITGDDGILFTHRKCGNDDIYFLSNQNNRTTHFRASFHSTGKRPELWDAVTGHTRLLPEYTTSTDNTTIPLQLEANGSAFIIFHETLTTDAKPARDAKPASGENFPAPIATQPITSTWQVSFDTAAGGPPNPIAFPNLTDWTKSEDPRIKYYSGTAIYHNTFIAPTPKANRHILLDLGSLTAMARIGVNGVSIGGVWTAPYRLDITSAVHPGRNTIEIAVVNNWMNRLIGDAKLPAAERRTWTSTNPYNGEATLQPSGLFGPVTLQIFDDALPPKHQEPKIVNIVNFIRLLEPRDPAITEDVLYQTVVNQVRLMRQNRLGGTFLLQYDALLDKRYQTLLRSLPKDSFEIGAWWEIPQPLVENAGMKWRGRYPWDWRANIGFSTGYTPREREKLIDIYMRDFKNIFGYYPSSVASWFIDAYSLDYMYRKYHIVASANCNDQYGTDGYTLWGGYWNQAYYPSRKNSYMPAQNERNQIPVPIFRMLGSDPVRQYDNGLGTTRQGVVTLEPVYKFGGGDSAWIDWFFNTFTNDESLGFNYTQAGQENSFTWNAMQKGLEIQFPLMARLRVERKLRVETLETSGRWFRKHYHTTPATAFTVTKDIDTSTQKTAWFDSRYYRTNLLWENGSLRIRDIHLFNEDFPSIYTTQVATSNECTFFTLPVIDGYIWSKPGQLAGARLMANIDGKTQPLEGLDPKFSSPDSGTLHISWPLKTIDGTLEIDLTEKQFSIRLKANKTIDWFFDLTTADSAKLPFTGIEPQTLSANFENMNYSIKAKNGSFSKPDNNATIRISPEKNSITLDMGQR